jgi:hypothetical protein
MVSGRVVATVSEPLPSAQRVADVPEEAVFFFAFHLQIAHRRLEYRVPADQTLAAVDQTLLVQPHKGFGHHLGQLVVHGEVFMAPVHAVAHAAHLRGDGVAALFLPFPHPRYKVLAAQVVAAHLLVLQLALHHDLGGDAGMVGARHPEGVVPAHAVVARQAVHDGLVERVPHVQRAGHVGWRQLDREGRLGRIGLAGAAHTGTPVTPLLPQRSPVGLDGRRFKRLGKAVQARLVQGVGHPLNFSRGP